MRGSNIRDAQTTAPSLTRAHGGAERSVFAQCESHRRWAHAVEYADEVVGISGRDWRRKVVVRIQARDFGDLERNWITWVRPAGSDSSYPVDSRAPTYTINENKIRSDHGINGRTTYVGV